MTEQVEATGPHRARCQTKELIIDGLGNQPPQAAILDIRDRLSQPVRQADCRHQWRCINALLTHAFQSVLNEAGCDIMAFHELIYIAKTIRN
jgi:hypothetical protein